MGRNVLLLNMNYTPVGILPWKKAVGLVIGRKKADIITEYNELISKVFNAAVIKLNVKTPDHFSIFTKQKFSKRNLFLRDNFECQYCGITCTGRTGTIDHILPRSCGGRTDYINCVVACKRCNFRKDNRTPSQAEMPLRSVPRQPTLFDLFNSMHVPDEWKLFVGQK